VIVAQDTHTSDITANCGKSVELRLLGKRIPEATEALFCGQLFHEAVGLAHKSKLNDFLTTPAECVETALPVVLEGFKTEGRTLSRAVVASMDDHKATVVDWLKNYIDRFAAEFSVAKLIGVEVPCRWSLDVDGETEDFASHLDLLYRTAEGALVLWDWKSGAEAPSTEFLIRNLQMGLYHLALKYGSIMLDGQWVEMEEHPVIEWVHVRYLMPYGKKVTTKDEDGVETTYAKGDTRPRNKVVIPATVTEAGEQALVNELSLRVRMKRLGLYPTNPSEQGCRLCESRRWCPNWRNEYEHV